MATGGEAVSATFTVLANSPSVTMNPSNSVPNSTLAVNFTGDFTHFAKGVTSVVISGQGVTIQNFTVTSAESATATLVVAANAPLGGYLVTLKTPLSGGGDEIPTTWFDVTAVPVYLQSINPYHAPPSTSVLGIEIIGVNTHFAQGQTTLTFGPDVTVSTLNIVSLTDLTATMNIDAVAALGWRNAYVDTGAEQVTAGFRIDGPDPIVIGVTPWSGAQGQTLQVAITGQNTHFQQSVTEAILGTGITVSNLAVTSPTTATATVAISPTAPAGPNTVVMITGSEVASGAGFNVTPGAAQILYVNSSTTPCVAPPTILSVTQSQTLNVCIVGQLSHWQQGVTTANFGQGIAVDALTISSPTAATAQITVLSTAPLGFEPVTLLTNGEYAMIDQGINVVQGTAALLSSSPNSAQQGSTLNVQVLGSLTHWQTGVTNASYSIPGIVVNSFTAQDSDTGVMNVSVSPLAPVLVLPACASLTITTGTEQVGLANQFCVQPGPATLTSITPSSAVQGSTPTVTVTGQSTHFIAGVTTASFGTGINVSNVNVLSPTSATVSLAVTSSAPTGYHTVTLTTEGENASLANVFQVTPGAPSLNQCSPVSGQQGQSHSVHCIGQFTSWVQGVTTATFGPGVTVNSVTVDDATDTDVALSIDPLAQVGGRNVTFTTNTQIVSSSSIFSVAPGPAIISQVTPGSANQGQEVVLSITGENTHWAQGLTQFSVDGAGIDIRINNVVINGATNANADITVSPTAGLGTRGIYMVTGGEALVDESCPVQLPGCVGGLIITGGIPSINGLSPNGGNPGNTNLNVQISGAYTNWTSATATVDFGPGITVQNYTVNNSTSITAVVNIDPSAALGYRTVTVQTGTQAIIGSFNVFTPPPPYIWPYYPLSGIAGQTITMSFTGNSTNWAPNSTQIVFSPETGAITVNSFQVLSPTSATANITIASSATAGLQTITFTTGTEIENVPFNIAKATPTISIVDPSTGMEGATLNVNVIGQYTSFSQGNTSFSFGSGITVNSVTVLGPTIAQVNITVGQLATQTCNPVVATTGTQVVSGSCSPWPYGDFTVTQSQAVILSISPNTAMQGATLASVNVVGQNTHWDDSTTFSFGSGITVTGQTVNSATSATLTLAVAALATTGKYSLTATTGGEVATLVNAFVVQAGTPLILSSAPTSGQQQGAVIFTILGQFTNWDSTTTVSYGTGITISQVNVTSPTAITVNAVVQPTTYLGPRNLTVTTGTQVLPLPNAFVVLPGPAVVSGLSPSTAQQGQTLSVVVTGTNTNFVQNVTAVSFGAGVTVNSVTVTSPTSATVNITVSASATPGLNTVTMTTAGETATDVNAFTITQATPELTYINPSSGYQGQVLTNVAVTALSTHFNSTTVFSFGTGIVVTPVSINSATSATVSLAISPNAHAFYSVFVHRLARLLHASFRPRLATTPLRFANPSPPSGWVEDFHLQTVEHARHTGWRIHAALCHVCDDGAPHRRSQCARNHSCGNHSCLARPRLKC